MKKASKKTSIKSVDFKIEAVGHGVVNQNGNFPVRGLPDETGKRQTVKNHRIPKMRGHKITVVVTKDDGTTYNGAPNIEDFDLKKNPVYVSETTQKFHLFPERFTVTPELTGEEALRVLVSVPGLVGGFVVSEKGQNGSRRTSSLFMEDLIEQTGNGNIENKTKAGSRDSKANLFSNISMGDTKYVGYGSISVDQLQFIACDNLFGRASTRLITEDEGQDLAKKLTDHLEEIAEDSGLKPECSFYKCWTRKGALTDLGEAGVVLNGDAIEVVVQDILERLADLEIRQSDGYLAVTNVTVDYNDGRMMRIKDSDDISSERAGRDYRFYYEQGSEEAARKSSELMRQQKDAKDKKRAEKKATKKKAKKKVA